jgi:hypothetical protein
MKRTILHEDRDAKKKRRTEEASLDQPASLENLPKDVVYKELSSLLNLSDFSKLPRLSKNCYSIYNDLTAQKRNQLHELYSSIQETNYERMREILCAHPNLMFETYMNVESPLQLAFKLYDVCAYTICLNMIQHNPGFKTLFLQQLNEQQKHVDLNSIILMYNTTIKQIYQFNNYNISQEILQKAIVNLGLAQRNLPRHILNSFCSCETQPSDGQPPFSIYLNNKFVSIFPIIPEKGLGIDYVLMRTNRILGCLKRDVPLDMTMQYLTNDSTHLKSIITIAKDVYSTFKEEHNLQNQVAEKALNI